MQTHHVVDVDVPRRALAHVDVRYGPVHLDSTFDRDAIVARPFVIAVLERAILTTHGVEAICVRVKRGEPWSDVKASKVDTLGKDRHERPR